LVLVILAGCGAGTSQEILGLRKALLKSSPPTGAVLIAQAKRALPTAPRVVISGWIGGGETSPWRDGLAEFVITEALPDEQGHRHKPGEGDDCPFCRRRFKPEELLAVVQIADPNGRPLAIDAREILGAKDGALVYVEGPARIDESGILTVQAQGIFLPDKP
jgi:hypothetical protein